MVYLTNTWSRIIIISLGPLSSLVVSAPFQWWDKFLGDLTSFYYESLDLCPLTKLNNCNVKSATGLDRLKKSFLYITGCKLAYVIFI